MIRIINILLLLGLVLAEYKAVDELNLNYYVGEWLEVYGNNFDKLFQGNGKCIKAFYKLNEKNISVLNTEIDSKDKLDSITGYAFYKDNDYGGYLTVQLEGQSDAPYWVIELGPIVNNLYDYAIVSDNLRLSLFVLARNVTEFFDKYNKSVSISLKKFGFDNIINKPYEINQDNCSKN